MNFSEKLPAFDEPAGAAGKLLIASMNIFHTPCPSGDSHLDLAGMKNPRHRLRSGINCPAFLKKVPAVT